VRPPVNPDACQGCAALRPWKGLRYLGGDGYGYCHTTSTKGRFIVDAHGHRVRLAGVNWYGASEDSGVPTGLDHTKRDTLAGLIAAQGFNRPLIICEGLNYAGDLTGVAHHPVQLAQPGKVVYSMHDYSWSSHQGENQAAYNNHMRTKGGYLLASNTAPVWIGEFGDDASAVTPHTTTTAPSEWRDYILAWLNDQDVDWCWWALNPSHNKSTVPGNPAKVVHHQDEVETFGLLTPDWSDVGHPAAMTALKAIIPPRTGPGAGVMSHP